MIDLAEAAEDLNAAPVASPAPMEDLRHRVRARRLRRRGGLAAIALAAAAATGIALAGLNIGGSTVVHTAGTGTTIPPRQSASSVPPRFPAKSNDPATTNSALQMLDSLILPADATPAATLPGSVFAQPWTYPMCNPLVDVTRYWTVTETPQQALAFFQAHPIPGVGTPGPGTSVKNGTITAYYLTETPQNIQRAAQQKLLALTFAPTTVGITGIRADALAVPPGSACFSVGGPLTANPTPPITALTAGVFADNFHFHVTTMSIDANGTGTASWRITTSDTAHATFHLTSVNGDTAQGIIDTSTDPSAWTPGKPFRLLLQSNDMLIVTPSGPFAPMCGTAASQESQTGNPPPGVNCGA